jgi:ion channel-forming bestrophin family protein
MLVANKPRFSRVVRHFGLPLISLFVWDLLIVVAYKKLNWSWVSSEHIPLALYGSAISIVVAFRNNTAYSRWWEARNIWGQIINGSRNLARQICGALHSHPDALAMGRRIIYHQIAYVHALRQQLRGLDPIEEIGHLLTPTDRSALESEKNLPLAIQHQMGSMLNGARQAGWIDAWEWQSIDRTLSEILAAQGGAERIKNTPLPKQYDFFVLMFVQAYCLMLPIGMVSRLGWFTPLGSTFVGFTFLAMDRIGRSLEDPFSNDVYDVPLTAMSKTVEINLRQMLKEAQLPDPGVPVDGVLW